MAMFSNRFVHFLPILPFGHGGHHQILGGHVRELFLNISGYHGSIHNQSVGDIQCQFQTGIGGQKGLRNIETTNGGIIKVRSNHCVATV